MVKYGAMHSDTFVFRGFWELEFWSSGVPEETGPALLALALPITTAYLGLNSFLALAAEREATGVARGRDSGSGSVSVVTLRRSTPLEVR